MIELRGISVSFTIHDRHVYAVKNASFTVNKGEIFGIVGTSGAGKSTLLRVINLLQRPTSGSISINGRDITNYKGEKLRKVRLKTGMIFQHFNLMHTKTVFDNVAFAMKAAGRNKTEIKHKVTEVLTLVGLIDKAKEFPSHLSGGQKQRVGIARAIVNEPHILLCDEPTSALDIETTHSILELLHEINKRLGITTVLISHEMAVIKEICDRVAVMTDGNIVELASVYDVFAEPKNPFTRQLVNRTLKIDLPKRILNKKAGTIAKLVYRGASAEEPILTETSRKFNVALNVLHGKIEYINDKALGILIVAVNGNKENVGAAIVYLKNKTAETEILYE